MDMEFSIGTLANTRVNGEMIEQMDRENSYIMMVICILVNGEMISCMGMGYIHHLTRDINMRDHGRIIRNMDMEKKHKWVNTYIQVTISMIRNMGKVTKYMKMVQNILVNGLKIELKGKEYISKMVRKFIKGNGKIFRDKGVENLYMMMEVNMKGIFIKI